MTKINGFKSVFLEQCIYAGLIHGSILKYLIIKANDSSLNEKKIINALG